MTLVDEQLRAAVCAANQALPAQGLAVLTWGNVSGISADRTRVIIKPSGVEYAELTPEALVVVDLEGRVAGGTLRPSSDTPTHVALYRAFPAIGAIVHTHSPYATAFAQARRPISCLGTTHADHFHGSVPLTHPLTAVAVAGDYEAETAAAIIAAMHGRSPIEVPGMLVAGHGPFVWGPTPRAALEQAVALEAIARLAWLTFALDPAAGPLEPYVLEKHHHRKHGHGAYYGQAGA